ncbi:hypothetical protein [Leclercia sp.]|uniref:hypothetical protein n=1 Tax=Leclercia sp. TaxID=1898428 RepID=UPI002FDE9C3E
MKNVIFAIALATISAGVSASVTCLNYGSMTSCSSVDTDGQPVNTVPMDYGSMSTTPGKRGDHSVNAATQQYGNMTTSN